jgi:hypothetical protein
MKFHRFSDLKASGRLPNRMTAWRWIEAGLFPPPVDLGPNSVAWTDESILERDERVKAGISTPNEKWLAKLAERKARLAARKTSAAA